MKKTRAIDLSAMPRHFDAARAEQQWAAVWEREGYYRYDPDRPRDETFAIDTPPPTVSGSLHIGHVFSYAHTDMVARYQRMRGKNIFYPMGWDDNGLPTERRVQNLYHVQCDPHAPYEPGLELTLATAKQRKKPRRAISRLNFIERCHAVTQQDEQAFKALWQRIGLSVDWRQEYATIGDRARQIAQLSFLDLFEKGHVYMSEEPIMWDVTFQTAVAQAEVKERDEETAMHEIAFGIEGTAREIVIATTRPELLPACVGVTAHPDDARYRDLFGKRAVTPLFAVPVPIFASDEVDPEKGTGIVMVCTFGDATDVEWWHAESLALRQIVGRDGRLLEVVFGEPGWESRDAERANRTYERLAGLPLKAARKRIVALLGEAEDGADAALRGEPEAFVHAVKFYEKGSEPLEIIPARQWMVRLLDKKDDLLRFGDQVQWHPAFMQTRFDIWTQNLLYDWTISRQRYFGVAIPVWYPLDGDGEPDYDHPIVALPEQLPVDPMVAAPPGYDEAQRSQPGGFTGEADVFDTWFTSSMSPQVTSGWVLDPARHARLFPFDLRPQAHEIIRTWAFYTIAKSMLHEGKRPWRHALISGWVLATDKQKMSKSQGNVLTPDAVLDRFTVDGVRYWAANVRYGVDTVLDENMLKIGKRLVTKLFNAGKFVYAQSADTYPITQELDRAFAHEVGQMVEAVTPMMDAYEGAQALSVIEDFFWRQFTDTYLELVKTRARGEAGTPPDAAGSAVAGLRLGMNVLLRLFAPFLPYITEEVWSWIAAEETGYPSIHTAPWPGPADLDGIAPPDDVDSLRIATAVLAEIRKHKADAAASVGRPMDTITIAAAAATLARLRPVAADVMDAARAQHYVLEEKPSVPSGVFEVVEAVFVA